MALDGGGRGDTCRSSRGMNSGEQPSNGGFGSSLGLGLCRRFKLLHTRMTTLICKAVACAIEPVLFARRKLEDCAFET